MGGCAGQCRIDLRPEEFRLVPRRSNLSEAVGHETIVHREDRKRLPHWLQKLFAFMQRNSVHVSDFFRLPTEAVVELGRQVSI